MTGLRAAATLRAPPTHIAPLVDLYFCLILFFSYRACACTPLALEADWFRMEGNGMKVAGYLAGGFGQSWVSMNIANPKKEKLVSNVSAQEVIIILLSRSTDKHGALRLPCLRSSSKLCCCIP